MSWGAVLAGTAAMLAVAILLWMLALAIVALATHATLSSVKGSVIALWICAMATTLVGAVVGGRVAGYLPGNPRPTVGAVHGFIAWAVALILSFGFQLFVLRDVAGAATTAAIDAMATVETTETTAPANANPNVGAPGPRGIPGATGGPALPSSPSAARHDATAAGQVARNYTVAFGWSWFGTWFVAGLLAMAAGRRGVPDVERLDRSQEVPFGRRPIGPVGPATPAPSA